MVFVIQRIKLKGSRNFKNQITRTSRDSKTRVLRQSQIVVVNTIPDYLFCKKNTVLRQLKKSTFEIPH